MTKEEWEKRLLEIYKLIEVCDFLKSRIANGYQHIYNSLIKGYVGEAFDCAKQLKLTIEK